MNASRSVTHQRVVGLGSEKEATGKYKPHSHLCLLAHSGFKCCSLVMDINVCMILFPVSTLSMDA